MIKMKKTHLISWVFLFTFMTLLCCKKGGREQLPPESEEGEVISPAVKPKGNSTGTPVSKTIGSGGGTVQSGDGKLQITLPANSIEGETQINIQPITNTLTEGSGNHAYRIESNGVRLRKPVTLTFYYKESILTDGAENGLMVAYQRNDGIWCALPTALNSQKKSLSITTDHFSDWMFFENLTLRKDKEKVEKGDQVELDLFETGLLTPLGPKEVDEWPLSTLEDFTPGKNSSLKWKIVEGPGKLEVKRNSRGAMAKAIYTAPEAIPESKTVTVQVEITTKGSLPDPNYPGGRRPIGKLILLSTISLSADFHFKGKIGGKAFNFDLAGVRVRQLNLLIDGKDKKTGMGLNIYCNGLKENVYLGGKEAGEFYMTYSENVPRRMFWSFYRACSEGEKFNGKVTFVHVTDDYIEGTVNGIVYFADNLCGFTESKDVSGTFKVPYYD